MRLKGLGLFGSEGSPGRRATIVCAYVAAFALVMFSAVGVLAPRFAGHAPTRLSAGPGVRGLAVAPPGFSSAAPTPTYASSSATFSPDPTATTRIEPATAAPRSSPPSDDAPARLVIAMNVDKSTASTADYLTYSVVAKNVGTGEFNGALTINVHTPTGTLRCETMSVVETCTTAGDYDGSSRSPNAPHMNPPGTTGLFRIGVGRSVTLLVLKVFVEPGAGGTTLHNHAHVDGPASITESAPNVTTKSAVLGSSAKARDVPVSG